MAFDFSSVGVPFRMQPGLRRLPAAARQFTPTRPGEPVFREKLGVLTTTPDQALLVACGFDALPLWRRVAARAAAEHGDALTVDAEDAYTAPALGWSLRGHDVCGDGPEEIGACLRRLAPDDRLAGLLALAFAEDLALLDGATGRVPGLAVCLPSRWIPADKVGRRFADIHAPVAEGSAITAAADALVRLVVTGETRWERFVWTLSTSPSFDGHPHRVAPPPWDETASPEALAAAAYFRTEQQIFSAFADAALALFTIRVEVRPLSAALERVEDLDRLQAALATMSPAVLAYRGLTPARDGLLRWLDDQRARL